MGLPHPAADATPDSGLVFATPVIQSCGAKPTRVEPPPPSAITLTVPPRPTARLVVVRGERPDVSFRLLDGKNFIGRTADFAVDIDLDGQETLERTWASRRHAVVIVDGGAVTVEDLRSLNGTFVNRTRLPAGGRKTLRPGDVVQVGTVQLKLVVE